MQRAEFVDLFEIMRGLPVTIRLLDPPLHEFLPHTQGEIEEVARAMQTDPRKLADRARDLSEFNPMLGFRGVRLAIAYPEIAEMQARALEVVPYVPLGTMSLVRGHAARLSGILEAAVPVYWNIAKA